MTSTIREATSQIQTLNTVVDVKTSHTSQHSDRLTQLRAASLPVWLCRPRGCWCSACCRHFPEPADSACSSSHMWSSLCVCLESFGKGSNSQRIPRISRSPSVSQVFVFALTEHRNLAWGLPIVNQQVSLDCPDCQQWTGLWPQEEGHLIFAGTNRKNTVVYINSTFLFYVSPSQSVY